MFFPLSSSLTLSAVQAVAAVTAVIPTTATTPIGAARAAAQAPAPMTPAFMSLLDTGLIQISFRLSDEIGTVRELLKRYQNVPMSLG